MPFSPLPFKVLGQVAPILAWAEGDFGSRLPSAWKSGSQPFAKRERSWLLGELPTYSYDTVDDIVAGARRHHRKEEDTPARLPSQPGFGRPNLDPPANFDLIDSFRSLNDFFFLWNGTEPCIREGSMEELHELAIRLPLGHVIRYSHARAVAGGVIPFEQALELPELVTLLPSNSFGMRNIIRKGLSESHLHLKAVVSAEETWANNLLRPLNSLSIRGGTDEERRLLLLNLFAGRLLAIAVWMSLPEAKSHGVRPQHLLKLMDRIYFARTEPEETQAAKDLRRSIRKAVSGEEEEGTFGKRSRLTPLVNLEVNREYWFLLRWISPTAFRLQSLRKDRGPGDAAEGLRERFAFVQRLHLAAHLRLVQLSDRRGESGLGGSDPKRHFLHQALFRYLVCQTHHWQMATQQGQTTGLSHFREFYGSPHRRLPGLSDLEEADLVFERLRQWRGLRVLEGRVSPPDSPQDLVPWILNYARPEDRRLEKFGLVVHFKKEDEYKEDKSLATESPPVPRLRWGLRRRRLRAEGMRLYRLLRKPTPVVPFVVGIDACNLELTTPPEVFAPVFRFLREMPISTAPTGRRRFSPYYNLEPAIHRLSKRRRLGMTYHVGEDFRHLLSGLRAIHEVVEFLEPQPGDRLGHGTALALRPEVWLKHNGFQAVLSRLEWLDTLVWVHHFLGPGDKVVGELALEDRIQRQAWKIYSPALASHYDPLGLQRRGPVRPRRRGLLDWDWSPLTLWDAWKLRQLDPYSVNLTRLCRGELRLRPLGGFCEEEHRWHVVQERVRSDVESSVGSRNAYLMLALYWLSPQVRRIGDEALVIDMRPDRDRWLELCRRVEQKMTALIRDREMVVEVNPSSNRLIGPMARYDQHHLFQLTLDENQQLSRSVRVSINTDNPAVCNTTLAHEHYLVGEILMKRGVAEAEVVEWLEWLRQNGQEYCFARQLQTVDQSADMRALVEWLRRIRPSVLEARTRGEKHQAFRSWHRRTRLAGEGFDSELIDTRPVLLSRLLSLESSLAELEQQGTSEQPELRDLIAHLRRLEDGVVF